MSIDPYLDPIPGSFRWPSNLKNISHYCLSRFEEDEGNELRSRCLLAVRSVKKCQNNESDHSQQILKSVLDTTNNNSKVSVIFLLLHKNIIIVMYRFSEFPYNHLSIRSNY